MQEYIDTDRLNRILVAIVQGIKMNEFSKTYGMLTPQERSAWHEIQEEVLLLASQGIATEIPAEMPDFAETRIKQFYQEA